MIVDLGTGAPEQLQADVAIVGAGAAGLTLARRLLEGGRSILLLESGGSDYEPDTADLNRGEVTGEPYYDLREARLRFFGGTTAVWGGRSAELDPIDFEQREWVPWSGWPLTHDDLKPWYRAARHVLELPANGLPGSNPLLERLAEGDLALRHWLIDAQFDRFGFGKNADLLHHPKLTVALHATVREIMTSPSADGVLGLDVRAPGGQQLRAIATAYVLAAGGLENPRILLASNSVVPAGLGNRHDLVGRFFMEHPHGRGGRIVNASAWRLVRAFQKRGLGKQEQAALIAASPELQRKRRTLNSALTVAVRPPLRAASPCSPRPTLRPSTRSIQPTAAASSGKPISRPAAAFGKGQDRSTGGRATRPASATWPWCCVRSRRQIRTAESH